MQCQLVWVGYSWTNLAEEDKKNESHRNTRKMRKCERFVFPCHINLRFYLLRADRHIFSDSDSWYLGLSLTMNKKCRYCATILLSRVIFSVNQDFRSKETFSF